MKHLFFLLGLIFLGTEIQAQLLQINSIKILSQEEEDEEVEGRGFSISMNIGVYFASKKSAILYNGNCYSEFGGVDTGIRCYSIEDRLGIGPNGNFQNTYTQILNYYNNQGDGVSSMEIPKDSYPTNIRYTPSFMYGLNLSYYFNYFNGIVFNLSSLKLTASDAFSVKFVGTSPQPNQPEDVRLFTVWGEESRLNLMLGYKKGWEINTNSRFFMEFGGTMLASKLISNKITIAGQDYDLILGGDNPATRYQYRPTAQIGFGYYISPGIQFSFNDKLAMDLGVNIAREKVVLINNEFKAWNTSVYIRFGI